MFDVTGLDVIKMRKRGDWQGAWYVLPEDHTICVAKTCSSCKEILPAEEFGLGTGKPFDLQYACGTCNRTTAASRNSAPATDGNGTRNAETRRKSRERNKARTDEQVLADRRRKRPTGEKRCLICRITRPLSEYGADRGLGDGLRETCKSCQSVKDADRRTKAFIAYWEANGIPLRCYLCDGPFEEIEHLIPTSLHGDPGPINTRPACWTCNRGQDVGKYDKPLEEYIFTANHPTKTRAKILHEIVMSGTWPFTLTTPEEFIAQSREYSDN